MATLLRSTSPIGVFAHAITRVPTRSIARRSCLVDTAGLHFIIQMQPMAFSAQFIPATPSYNQQRQIEIHSFTRPPQTPALRSNALSKLPGGKRPDTLLISPVSPIGSNVYQYESAILAVSLDLTPP